MKKFIIFFLLVIVGLLVYNFLPEKEIKHPSGILAPDEPIQKPVFNKLPWQKDEFTFIPLAEFKIKAKVLSRNNFSLGKESEISPLDLALGWGPMSNQAIIDMIEVTQRNRWYNWKAEVLLIPAKEISTHSANMHIIPANDLIEENFDNVYKGSLVELTGYLVEVKAEKGWRWKSSLKRDDTGGGACEVVWVDDLKIIN